VRRVVAGILAQGDFEDSDAHPFYDRIIQVWGQLGAAAAAELA
jgi:hypothetical protein